MTSELRTTPLHSRHLAAGGKMVPFAGYHLPIQYAGITAEHNAVRTQAGLFDVSHMGELRVRGPNAVIQLNALVTNDLERVAVGQALYTCACREDGGILDDLILYKHADDDILVVCNASNHDKILAHLSERLDGHTGVQLEDESDRTALLALQGPRAFSVLAALSPDTIGELQALRPFRFKNTTLLGHAVTVARTGYTGEDGVEIFSSNQAAPSLWDALLERGAPLGLIPTGLGCRDTLRLEARLSLYGNELEETIHPLEAGLAWTVKLNKSDFLGKEALVKIQEGGLTRRLVGFEMLGRGVARHGYPLVDSRGDVVGICTSGSPSPTLGKAIGLGFLPLELNEIGTKFGVDCRGKIIEAQVVQTPFYKRNA